MTRWIRTTYVVVVWMFLILLLAQVFLAGLGVFGTPTDWDWHRVVGYDVIWPVAFVLLIVAFLSRLPRETLLLVLATAALTSVLPFLPSTRSTSAALAALHPVIAFLVVGLVILLALQARGLVAAEAPAPREG